MPKVTFKNKNAVFFPTLKSAVDQYFTEHKLKKTGNWRLYHKTIILFAVTIGLYIALLWGNMPVLANIIGVCILGTTLALIGFNVMHDACHGSYSENKTINDLMGYSLNILGGNSFMWKQKHNIIHHTYTNVDGLDDDIAKHPFIRMCSTQKWVKAHKYQHLYLTFLYGISSIFWIFYQDFVKYFSKMVYTTPLPKMPKSEHIIFWLSKVFYLIVYIIVPIVVVGWQTWLVGFLLMHLCMGITLSVIFQLAHVVEDTSFEYVGHNDTIQIENEWAIHQIKTTANFSPNSKIISWLVGGLNYQIEHHLFPRISHIHYPEISKIVAKTCQDFDIPYIVNPTLGKAVKSHYSFIKYLGQNP